MLFKWITFWVFTAPKRGCFPKFLKKEKLVQVMLFKRLNFWYFQPMKRDDFRKTKKHAHLDFSRRVIWYLPNIFSIFLRFSSDLQKQAKKQQFFGSLFIDIIFTH